MSKRLLAVEDTPSLRALLQLCLTKGGYEVDIAEDGQTAVELFRAGAYDAVVMDIQMPVMDGLTAVGLMRDHEREEKRPAAPIMALTANTEPADLSRCVKAGFTGTVRKPFGREELLTAVASALGTATGERIRVAADPAFAALIPQFLANCRRDAAAMKEALARGDFQSLAAASHKMTGAGASYGFQPLSDEARLIEAAAKSRDGGVASGHLDKLLRYLDQVTVVYP